MAAVVCRCGGVPVCKLTTLGASLRCEVGPCGGVFRCVPCARRCGGVRSGRRAFCRVRSDGLVRSEGLVRGKIGRNKNERAIIIFIFSIWY